MVARPHGGRLVRRVATGARAERLAAEAREMHVLELPLDLAADAENIARGVYSPLEGFLVQEDYLHVLDDMRLADDTPWTIPIVLPASPEELASVGEGDEVALSYGGEPFALMRVEEIYGWDKREYALKVYGTRDVRHPGVAKLESMGELLVGGRLELFKPLPHPFSRYALWPEETRVLFEEKGWRTIAGFQTRNVPHRGHEYVQKAALTFVDGLLIHPLVGWKKPGDYRDEVIVAAYEALIDNYFPRDSVVFAVLRMAMRYAGPREAVHHAIVRKNFGCTHFIVGRDHAGVGDFYGPYDAWEIFREFPDLGVVPLFIREAFYCEKCGGFVNEKICPHGEEHRVRVSGTRLREMIRRGEAPPPELMRPEVARVVLSFENPFT